MGYRASNARARDEEGAPPLWLTGSLAAAVAIGVAIIIVFRIHVF